MLNQTRSALSTQGSLALQRSISPKDREVLRGLAAKVAEVAARPIEQEKRAYC